jgi:hypothetical protein
MNSRHLLTAGLNQPKALGWGFDMAAIGTPESVQPRRSTSLPTVEGLDNFHRTCLQGASMSPQEAVVQAAALEQQDSLVHLLLEKVSSQRSSWLLVAQLDNTSIR